MGDVIDTEEIVLDEEEEDRVPREGDPTGSVAGSMDPEADDGQSVVSDQIPNTPRSRYINHKIQDTEMDEEEDEHGSQRVALTAIIRGIFDSDVSLEIAEDPEWMSIKQFCSLYKKICSENKGNEEQMITSIILDEVNLRLNFLIEDVSRSNDRFRVFVFLVICALKIHYKQKNSIFLNWLCRYATRNSECDNPNARGNCLRIVARIFRHWLVKPLYKDKTREMDNTRRDQMYMVLKKRCCDKIHTVRTALVHAMADIQDMEIPNDFELALKNSPKEIMYQALQDRNPTVQLAAIKLFDVSKKNDGQLHRLVHIAGSDTHELIRFEAIKTLGRVNVVSFNKKDLQDVLLTTILDRSEECCEFAKKNMLAPWLISLACYVDEMNNRKESSSTTAHEARLGYGSAILALMSVADFNTWTEDHDKLVYASLDCVRYCAHPGKHMNVAELATYFSMDKSNPLFLTRYTIKTLFGSNPGKRQKKVIRKGKQQTEDSDIKSPADMALFTWVWRCTVQYCIERTETENHEDRSDYEQLREECLQRLVPPLVEMIDFVEQIYKCCGMEKYFVKEVDRDREEYRRINITLTEALKACLLLEPEPYGIKKWQDQFERFIYNQSLQKSVTDQLGIALVKYFYDNPLEFVEEFLTETNFHEMYPKEKKIPVDIDLESPEMRMKRKTVCHCIQVMNGIFQTGLVIKTNVYVFELVEALITNCLHMCHAEARGWLYRLVAVTMLGSREIALKQLWWFDLVLGLEDPENKATVIRCYFDVVLFYGIDFVNSAKRKNNEDWIKFLVRNIESNPEDVGVDFHFACCEVACKQLILDPTTWLCHKVMLNVLRSVIISYFLPRRHKYKRFREMFQQFMVFFIQQSKQNVGRIYYGLLASVRTLLDFYVNGEEEVTEVVLQQVLESINYWCRQDLLHAEGEKTYIKDRLDTNYQILWFYFALLPEFVTWEPIVDIFTRSIAVLDSSRIPVQQLMELEKHLNRSYQAVVERYGVKSSYSQILLRMQKNIDTNYSGETGDKSEAVPTAEVQCMRVIRRRGTVPIPRQARGTSAQRALRTVSFDPDAQEDPSEQSSGRAQQFPRAAKKVAKNFYRQLDGEGM